MFKYLNAEECIFRYSRGNPINQIAFQFICSTLLVYFGSISPANKTYLLKILINISTCKSYNNSSHCNYYHSNYSQSIMLYCKDLLLYRNILCEYFCILWGRITDRKLFCRILHRGFLLLMDWSQNGDLQNFYCKRNVKNKWIIYVCVIFGNLQNKLINQELNIIS